MVQSLPKLGGSCQRSRRGIRCMPRSQQCSWSRGGGGWRWRWWRWCSWSRGSGGCWWWRWKWWKASQPFNQLKQLISLSRKLENSANNNLPFVIFFLLIWIALSNLSDTIFTEVCYFRKNNLNLYSQLCNKTGQMCKQDNSRTFLNIVKSTVWIVDREASS